MKNYILTGFVLGKLWGGRKGIYPSSKIMTSSKSEALKIAKLKLQDGSLDSGMGFEKLIGALLQIEEIETKMIDRKIYHASEFSDEFIGKLSENEQDELIEVFYHSAY